MPSAVPEERKITYFAFTPSQIPGGVPQPTQQQIQQYFTAHQSEYSVPEQARSRHILISVPAGADAKTDAAAKAKAEGILKQLQAGGNWADLAKKNSDDPGSKDSGGELGFSQRGRMVPEFDSAIFTQKIGDIKIVKSQFGYHIVQVEERSTAHAQSLSEVQPTIQATLLRQNEAQAEDNYAKALTSEAIKNGLDKTAAAHHLEVVTTPLVGQQGVIAALPDSSQVLSKAFASKQGDPPQSAPTGEGYAIFQVTGIAAGPRARIRRLEDARARGLSRRAASRPAGPEDHGAVRTGQVGERSGQGRQGDGRNREDQRPGWPDRPGARSGRRWARLRRSSSTCRRATSADPSTRSAPAWWPS